MNKNYPDVCRLIVKVGTGFIIDRLEDGGYVLREDQIDAIADEVAEISGDREVALVSSGAIGTAAWKLGLKDIPDDYYKKAQLSGIGQPCLMAKYQESFERHGKRAAQCLLSHEDITIRKRRRNLRKNQEGYFSDKVIAVYNENDFISIDDITFGDNDILAALLAKTIDADLLVMLSYFVDGVGTGGKASKTRAKKMTESEGIEMEIIGERYETDGTVYRPKIRKLLY